MLKVVIQFAKIVGILLLSSCMVVNTKSKSKLVNEDLSGFTANTNMSISSSKFSGPVVVNSNMMGNTSNFTSLTVNGQTELARSNITKSLMINGKAKLDEVKVSGSTQLSGESVVTASDLQDITFAARTLLIESSNVNNIHVGNVKNTTIRVSQGSIVHGDIVFVHPEGKVLIEDGAKVKGHIYVNRNGNRDFLEVKMQKNLWDQYTKSIDLDTVSEKVNNNGKYTRYSK
ncbi:MAG: hypothetical protein HON32_09275 [Francisellaceae bacterium]|mgnify:FL=1|nr:hypothetical protein [Francisellaceae bacterium]MBT6539415.1 hypothetical protein [Francisellaceae bacterium]